MTQRLTADEVVEALEGISPARSVEFYPVALTTEALALGWLRQRSAGHGSIVVAGSEISARTRSGATIEDKGQLAASMVIRPEIAADYQDIIWAIPLLAAAEAYRDLGSAARAWWPEMIMGPDGALGYTRVETQLSPGHVDSSVVTFRLGAPGGLGTGLDILGATLVRVEALLDLAPAELADRYRRFCVLEGEPVRVNLRPSGSSGGVGRSIDERGGFGVAATSGSVTRYGVDQIRDIDLREN